MSGGTYYRISELAQGLMSFNWCLSQCSYLYLKPKVTLHCYHIYHFWVLVSGILNVFNSY